MRGPLPNWLRSLSRCIKRLFKRKRPRPTVLLIHGGWHRGSCFAPLRSALGKHSYPSTAIDLPSVGDQATEVKTHLDDVAAIRVELERLIVREGKDVVLAMHSYGGLPGAGAVSGLEKKRREAAGEKGGVVAVMWMASYVVPKGVPLFEMGEATSWAVMHPEDGTTAVEKPHSFWYQDVPARYQSLLPTEFPPMSMLAFVSKAEETCWESQEFAPQCWYIMCENDRVIPIETQERMVKNAAKTGGMSWKVVRLRCGHSPWLAKIPETVECIRKAAGEEQVPGRFIIVDP